MSMIMHSSHNSATKSYRLCFQSEVFAFELWGIWVKIYSIVKYNVPDEYIMFLFSRQMPSRLP